MKVICDKHNGCVNSICEHIKPHTKIGACSVADCRFSEDQVECILTINEQRKQKLKKIKSL